MRTMVSLVLLVTSCLAQGDPKALYEEAMNKLSGVPPNRNEMRGVELMNRSADLGYLPAIIGSGTIYDTGNFIGANPSKAADLYRKAAGQGSHFGEYLLGRMYYVGSYGTARRDGEKWLQSAAEAGNPFAGYLLATSIYERDPNAAVRWLRPAAEQGLPYAQYRLGKALLEGGRVPMDKHQAYLWLYVARESGVKEAATDLSFLETDLGAAQTEVAKNEARDLREKVRRESNSTRCKGWPGELDPVPAVPPLDIQRYCE